MASYLIMKSCVAGGEARKAGEIVELSESEAKALTAMGRVQPVADYVPNETMDRSVGLESSESPKISKRTKKG